MISGRARAYEISVNVGPLDPSLAWPDYLDPMLATGVATASVHKVCLAMPG